MTATDVTLRFGTEISWRDEQVGCGVARCPDDPENARDSMWMRLCARQEDERAAAETLLVIEALAP